VTLVCGIASSKASSRHAQLSAEEEAADVFVCINVSTIELLDVEAYVSLVSMARRPSCTIHLHAALPLGLEFAPCGG
jgi:hypothetical protein